jgi:hypothetical protein
MATATALALETAVLMTMAKHDSKRNHGGGCGDGSSGGKGGDGMETLVASQISAAATTISAATAWTLVNVTSLLAIGWKVYFRLILFNIMLNLVNDICKLVYLWIGK